MKKPDRPRGESIVNKQLELTETFMDSLANPAWLIDVRSYVLIRVNVAARSIGIKEGIPCYLSFYDRNTPCDKNTGMKCHIKELHKGQEVLREIQEHTLKNGSKRILEIYRYPICDEEGKITHMMAYSTEISERVLVNQTFKELRKVCKSQNQDLLPKPSNEEDSKKSGLWVRPVQKMAISTWQGNIEKDLFKAKLEVEALQKLEHLKTELLSTVSHELRNPLSSIKGYTSTLLAEDVEWDREKQLDFLREIDEEADRLNRLIGDLLDMSRLEAGVLKLEKMPCSIYSLFESINGRLAVISQQHKLEISVPQKLPEVSIDEMRIGEVITNLVENATRFSEKDRAIKINVTANDDLVTVTVTDNGSGIKVENVDKVFDRFYSTDDTSSGQRKGLGLGLSICRGIVESHGGKIWVESKPGQGSKFSFSLPVASHVPKQSKKK